MLSEIVGKAELAAVDAGKMAEQRDAGGGERLQADGAQRSEHRAAGDPAIGLDELLARHVEETGQLEPDRDVVTTVASRQPAAGAGCQEDRTSGGGQLVGDLGAGLGAADDEHGPRRKRRRIAIVRGVELQELRRQRSGRGGSARTVQAAGRGDDGAGAKRALRDSRGRTGHRFRGSAKSPASRVRTGRRWRAA